jgi:6-phosphogluconolactonase
VRGGLSLLDSPSTLPPEFTGLNTTAEVRVHANGRFVYGSNRGHDSLAVFERDAATGLLSRLEIVPCGGQHPRHFSLSPDGAWLVCANMNSDSLTVFRVDAATGRLTRVPGSAQVSMPVCVLFYD